MDNTKVKAVIFDLGKVLVDVNFSKGIFGHFSNQLSNTSAAISQLYQEPLFRDYNSGRISSAEFYEAVNKKFKLGLSYRQFVDKWCNVFEPMPGMQELVGKVALNYKIGLLSDTDPLHWHYCLKQFPFLKIFTRPALSYEIGHLKPAAICYLSAANNIGVEPEQCLFVDDRQQNVLGAQKTGMQTLLFTSPQKLLADLQFLIKI